MLATFFASGLVHEIVITVPAGGGYGGPTLYFVLQCLATCLERRTVRLRRGPAARLFAAIVLLAPLPLLFPTPFVLRVILPFLHALGSYPKGAAMISLQSLLLCAGICHFGILIASALVPRVLDWRRELAPLA